MKTKPVFAGDTAMCNTCSYLRIVTQDLVHLLGVPGLSGAHVQACTLKITTCTLPKPLITSETQRPWAV